MPKQLRIQRTCFHLCFTFNPWVPNPLNRPLISVPIAIYKLKFGWKEGKYIVFQNLGGVCPIFYFMPFVQRKHWGWRKCWHMCVLCNIKTKRCYEELKYNEKLAIWATTILNVRKRSSTIWQCFKPPWVDLSSCCCLFFNTSKACRSLENGINITIFKLSNEEVKFYYYCNYLMIK